MLSAPSAVRAQDLPIPSADSAQAGDEADRRCLTLAIAYEAGNEPLAGREAVAEVVLNRLAHPAFPKSVCGVVFQGWRRATGCQFTFTCDGALRRRLLPQTLAAARAVADAALSGRLPHRVPGALNYHADYVRPYWAPTLDRVAKLGAHIFYRPLQGGVPVSGKDRDWSQDEPDQELVARVLGLGEAARYAAATPARQVGTPSGDSKTFAPWGLTLVR
ncbi:cell wall hydrolase [Novosphingobium huizhouense]|uniref:cell wall hydrolase n=1 Tax=Novosphingobium huizhouense TaxID=2866625 RepID=UPI001CD842C0|nr:cell wall hydrolase [Novosphingobium huizhouense]